MTTVTLLTVIALVASSGADSARIDKGFADGLRVGDQGAVYYELSVGGTKRRVDVASTAVTSVEADHAMVTTNPDRVFSPGFIVEFEVPRERVAPAAILAFARQAAASQGTEVDSTTLQRVMPSDAETQELLFTWLEEQRLLRLGDEAIQRARESVRAVRIAAGSYRIGPQAGKVQFYNQQPSFDFRLGSLAVDQRPVTRTEFQLFRPDFTVPSAKREAAVLVTYEDADAYCRWRGARLPTEFEWEVAIQRSSVTTPPGLLEWTASWYGPYPGNSRPEAEYGERYRVLRGGLGGAEGMVDPHRRRFMEPFSSSADVGFRCVESAAG